MNNPVSTYTSTGTFVNTSALGTPRPANGASQRYIEGLSLNYQQTLNLPPTSAPEPASFALVGIGLARRKRA